MEDSRTETWSLYYDKLLEAPIFGNGYLSFAGKTGVIVGVHNSYLRIMGEAGIIPLLIYIGIYGLIFIKSLLYFKTEGHLSLLVFIHNNIIDDYTQF